MFILSQKALFFKLLLSDKAYSRIIVQKAPNFDIDFMQNKKILSFIDKKVLTNDIRCAIILSKGETLG